ncbi:MAG: hydroxyphenylacetyl-CoA thioesterase PaaI [Pseudomonadota bacterium]
MDDQEKAERASLILHEGDAMARANGMAIAAIGPGTATLTLTVRDDHVNGHQMCHGGIIFALADTAFAHACNSRNYRCVAQHNTITYCAPAQLGDTLTAHATETFRQGRNGLYDVTVTGSDGTTIALFRGASRQISGTLFDE